MTRSSIRSILFVGAATGALFAGSTAFAQDTSGDKIRNADDIIVSTTRVNKETPITSSVHTFEPQSIVSRSIIENSVPPTADFSDVILLTPGASGFSGAGNGPGLGESKTVLRGFQDGQFNITYDGIPFGDSNDPTHHSTAYFPNGTYERIIVDRGPGSATDLGQSSFGGNVHIISRELSNKFFVEAQGVYGSYNTWLGRLTVNSGSIAKLSGLKIIGIGEWKQTKGALTGSRAWFGNGFLKAELPIGSNAKFSILGSYNQDLYNQSDNNGVSCTGSIVNQPQTDGKNCTATSQVGTYGKGYGLVDFGDSRFAGTAFTSARKDWNWTNKTTDFEIARLQWNINSNLSFDNKTYTYFYKNFTVSAEDTTTPCTAGSIPSQTTCAGYSTLKIGTGPGGSQLNGAQKTADTVKGDIPGYTKVNQYRTSGNIAQLTLKTSMGVGKVGFWYEHSTSHRYRYDYDFTKGFNNGSIADGYFNFAGMANVYNYKEAATGTTAATATPPATTYNLLQLNGSPVPAYVAYDEYTSWDQYQGFGEFAFKLLDDKLTITPGIKIQTFTRKINTPLAAQSSRVGISASDSYKPTLPYASINYLIKPNLSIYAQYAKGFLIPALSASLETVIPASLITLGASGTVCSAKSGGKCNFNPTKTTNYQAGLVYAGDRLNLDIDGYYIQTSNSTFVDPSTGIATVSQGSATYQGAEAQLSYVFMKGLTGIINGSLNTAKDDTTHLWLAQAPNYTGLIGAVYNKGPIKLSYLHKFTGRQFADTAQTVRIAPYSNGILAGSYTYRNFSAGVTVYNVFDDQSTTKIGSPTSTTTPLYFFQTGRSYEAQVKVKF